MNANHPHTAHHTSTATHAAGGRALVAACRSTRFLTVLYRRPDPST
jgi:hypothetical protein